MEEDELSNLEPCELFVTTSGESMQFSIKICPEKVNLQKIIEKCGGELHAKVGGLNTIRLLPLGDKPSQDEVFSSKFIYDCVRAQDLCDLNKYRINKTSLYTDDVDVMEILLGNYTWADCTRSGIKHSDVVSDFSDDDNVSSPTKKSYRGKLKGGRRDFTHTERSAIVKYIIENRRYTEVKAKQLWTDMEKANICPERTWQSLKEHYRKYIINNLHHFGLSDKQIKRLSSRYTEFHLREISPFSSSSSLDENNVSPSKKDKSPRKDVRSLNIDTGNLHKSRLAASNKESGENYHEEKDKELEENRIKDKMNYSNKTKERIDEKPKCSPKKNVSNVCKELSDDPQSSLIPIQDIEEMQEMFNDINPLVVNNTNSNIVVSQDISGNNSIFYSCPPVVINNEKSPSSGVISNSCSESENENSLIDQLPNISTHDQVLSANHMTSNLYEIDSDAKTETFYSEIEKDNVVESPSKIRGSIRTPIKSIASNANTVHPIVEAGNNKSIAIPIEMRKNKAQTSEISVKDVTTQNTLSNEIIGDNAEESQVSPNIEKQYLIPDSRSPKVRTQNSIYPNADGGSSSDSEVEVKRRTQNRHHRSGLTPEKSKFIRKSLQVINREENTLDIDSSAVEESTEIGENGEGKESERLKKKSPLSTTDESENDDHVDDVELFPLLEENLPLKSEKIDIDLVDDNESIQEIHSSDYEVDSEDNSEDDDILEDYEKKNSEDRELIKHLPSSSSSIKESKFQNYDNLDGRYDRTYNPKSGKRKMPKEESPNKRRKCTRVQHNIQGYYTVYEDIDILNYINQHDGFQEIGGNNLWMKMEKSKVIPGRSWPSLKERFRRRILQQLDSYLEHGLEQVVFDNFFSYKVIKKEKNMEDKNMEDKNMEDKRSFKDKRYTHQDDVKILEYIQEKNAYEMVGGRKMWQDMVESDILYSRSWLSLKERYRRVIIKHLSVYKTHGFTDRQLELFRSPDGGSDKNTKYRRWGSHKQYTHKEDQRILDFIVECKGYSEVGGKTLWSTMSEDISKDLKGRTWLSLKERFRKKIIHNLNNFKLTEEEKQHLINKTSLKDRKISHHRKPKGPGYKTTPKKKQSDIRDIYRVKNAQPSTSGYRLPPKENKRIDSSDEFEEETPEATENISTYRIHSMSSSSDALESDCDKTKAKKKLNTDDSSSEIKSCQESSKNADEPRHKYSKRTKINNYELADSITINKMHDEINIGYDINKIEKDLAALLSENPTPASPLSSILSNELPNLSEMSFEIEETTVENNNRRYNKSYLRANNGIADEKILNNNPFVEDNEKSKLIKKICSGNPIDKNVQEKTFPNIPKKLTRSNAQYEQAQNVKESNQKQEINKNRLLSEDECNKENKTDTYGKSQIIDKSDSTKTVESDSENYSLRRSSRKSASQISVENSNQIGVNEISNDKNDKDINNTTDTDCTVNNESDLMDNERKSDEYPKNQELSKKYGKQSSNKINTAIESISPRRKTLSDNETKSAKLAKNQTQSKNTEKSSPKKIKSVSPRRESPRRKTSVSPRRKFLSDNETKSAKHAKNQTQSKISGKSIPIKIKTQSKSVSPRRKTLNKSFIRKTLSDNETKSFKQCNVNLKTIIKNKLRKRVRKKTK